MPFTIAHAAAAGPVWWCFRRLSLSALIVGSMAPDFEYFPRLAAAHSVGHAWWGLFVVGLPASLFVLGVFHRLLKRPLLHLLPESLAPAASEFNTPYPFLPLSRLGVICLSIMLGQLTHIAWDSFTHPASWGVQTFASLQARVTVPVLGNTPVYKLVQYGSSVAGPLFLVVWALLWLRRHDRQRGTFVPLPLRLRWLVMFVLACTTAVGILFALAMLVQSTGRPWTRQSMVVTAILGGIDGLVLGALGYAILFHVIARLQSGGAFDG